MLCDYRIDNHEDRVVVLKGHGLDGHGDLDIRLPEHLLKTVEGQARQLGLDQIGSILHHDLELPVTFFALPDWDEVQHVHTLGHLPLLLALVAAELDTADLQI